MGRIALRTALTARPHSHAQRAACAPQTIVKAKKFHSVGSSSGTSESVDAKVNHQSGPVEWDVTDDVVAGRTAWVIKKTNEGAAGEMGCYAKEGAFQSGNPSLAPTLILTIVDWGNTPPYSQN